ncbi:hypothetical protein DPEC_G00158480 [Dallia pectoralis]|uniref:Uncharacterized protein n=1 Tax=Dallia pectoralis TaxID=75939 RepID=A0ACC2GL07_DALPE|nr:hypothetical protein DPEC_G00158480 [Dallia pectoralis]
MGSELQYFLTEVFLSIPMRRTATRKLQCIAVGLLHYVTNQLLCHKELEARRLRGRRQTGLHSRLALIKFNGMDRWAKMIGGLPVTAATLHHITLNWPSVILINSSNLNWIIYLRFKGLRFRDLNSHKNVWEVLVFTLRV